MSEQQQTAVAEPKGAPEQRQAPTPQELMAYTMDFVEDELKHLLADWRPTTNVFGTANRLEKLAQLIRAADSNSYARPRTH